MVDSDINKGCRVEVRDDVFSGQKVPPPDYADGDLKWQIPRWFRVNEGATKTFTTVEHHATSDSSGTAVMEKGGESESRVPSDPTTSWDDPA